MTDEDLRNCVRAARSVAFEGGTRHPLWDVIGQAERILADSSRPAPNRGQVERTLSRYAPKAR